MALETNRVRALVDRALRRLSLVADLEAESAMEGQLRRSQLEARRISLYCCRSFQS